MKRLFKKRTSFHLKSKNKNHQRNSENYFAAKGVDNVVQRVPVVL